MKKKILALCCALLLIGTSFAFAACGGDKDLGSLTSATQAAEVEALRGFTVSERADGLGWVTGSRAKEDGSYEYILYNVLTGENFTSGQAFEQKTEGLYYVEEVNETTQEVTVTCYGQGGQAKTGKLSEKTVDGALLFVDDNIVYCAPDGSLQTAHNSVFSKFLTYEGKNSGSVFAVGEKYFCLKEEYGAGFRFEVYGSNGGQDRVIDLRAHLVWTESTDVQHVWQVNETLFVQTTERADGSSSYTLSSNETKYRLRTYRYDADGGKFEAVNGFNYVAEDTVWTISGAEYAVLNVGVIEDKHIAYTGVQAFGEDGAVWADLQKQLPGASRFALDPAGSGYLLAGRGKAAVFKDGEKTAEVELAPDADYEGYGLFSRGDVYYDAEGNAVFTATEDMEDITVYNGSIAYFMETEEDDLSVSRRYVYDLATQQTTSSAEVGYKSNLGVGYLYLTEGTAEDTASVYFVGQDGAVQPLLENKALSGVPAYCGLVYSEGDSGIGYCTLVGLSVREGEEAVPHYYALNTTVSVGAE